MFQTDADTFLSLQFDEQVNSRSAMDATGNQISIARANVTNIDTVAGPYTGKRARRTTATAWFHASSVVANFDPRPSLRGSCTVQIVFKSLDHAGQPNHRTLFQCAQNGFGAHYFFSWYNPSDSGGIRVTYTGSQAGPNTGVSLQEEIETGLEPDQDTWYMLTVRKTVTSGSTDANKLNTIDVWLTPLDGEIDGTTPDFTRTSVLNPNNTTGTLTYSIGNWGTPSVLWPNPADFAGLRAVARALNASEIEESFARAAGASIGDQSLPLVSNITPTPGTAIARTQSIQFDVTDETDLRRVMIVAAMPDRREVIHDGEAFGPTFSSSPNAREAISGGYRYTVRRNGGWPAPPKIIPYVIDTSGNEAE